MYGLSFSVSIVWQCSYNSTKRHTLQGEMTRILNGVKGRQYGEIYDSDWLLTASDMLQQRTDLVAALVHMKPFDWFHSYLSKRSPVLNMASLRAFSIWETCFRCLTLQAILRYQESRIGAVVRALAFHLCGLGPVSQTPETVRAHLGCQNSLYIFAMPRF